MGYYRCLRCGRPFQAHSSAERMTLFRVRFRVSYGWGVMANKDVLVMADSRAAAIATVETMGPVWTGKTVAEIVSCETTRR